MYGVAELAEIQTFYFATTGFWPSHEKFSSVEI